MFKKFLKIIIIGSACCFQLSCTENVFAGLSSTTTDEGLFNDARAALNKGDYQTAIDIILNDISSDGRAKSEAKELLAGGYAGKCGLNFVDFITSLSGTTGTSAFAIVSSPFVGKTVDPASCLLALNTMQTIGPASTRTVSQNVFAAIAGMSLMGTSTRFYTDNVPDGGNGLQDAVDISCGLNDAKMDHIILGFGFMVENFSYLSSSQLGSSATAITDIITMCSTVGGSACNITNPADITPTLRTAFRKLLNTQEYGVGAVVTSNNPVLIALACP